MERNEVSEHEVRIYQYILTASGWVTSKEVAEHAQVAPRTARAHLLKLVRLGVVDQAEVFPAHRYQISGHAAKRNRGYVDRLERAAEALGVALV